VGWSRRDIKSFGFVQKKEQDIAFILVHLIIVQSKRGKEKQRKSRNDCFRFPSFLSTNKKISAAP
jgi:hypothetical protein